MADLSKLPVAPDDALISGRTWNLLRTAQQAGAPRQGTFELPEPPRGVEMLMMVVDAGPNGEAEPTDNTYWLKNVDVVGAESEEERIEAIARDDEDESQYWVLATNLAEQSTGTHGMPAGTLVRAKMLRDPNGVRRWEFTSGGGGEQTYPAKIEDWCNSKGGTYKVSVYMGPTTLVPSACVSGTLTPLAMPEGMAVPAQWFDEGTGLAVLMLAVHVKEDGLKTHWLEIGSWTVGTIRMSTNGFPVFFIQDGYARAIGGPYLESGTSLGDTGGIDSWIRDFIQNQAGDVNQYGDDPVQITAITRTQFSPGSAGNCDAAPPTLTIGMRTLQIDAQGHMAGIGSELAPLQLVGCCPPSTSLASASFTTDAQATTARALSAMVATNNLAA